MDLRNVNCRTRDKLSPVVAVAAAAALGLGTLGGASAPAQAALPPDDTPCTQGPTDGDPSLSEDSPWKREHGTSPIPFSGRPAADGPSGSVTPSGEAPAGSDQFSLRAPSADGSGLVPAADGDYDVVIGNGVCGEQLTAASNGGTLDLSQARDLIDNAHGQLMIQVKGPLNPDPATRGQHRFLDAHGQPADEPHLAHSGVAYDASHLMVPASSAGNSARNASTGLPVYDVGTDRIPIRSDEPIPQPGKATIGVTATYRDAATGEAVVVPGAAYLSEDPGAGLSIQQGRLKDLPSGRYRFSFTDDDGGYHQVHVVLGDAQHQQKPGESPLYDDPR